jgi:hypothetical protein
VAKKDKTDMDERVRVRAYHLWEEAGQPHGRDAEFWARAMEMEAPGSAEPQRSPAKAARGKAAKESAAEAPAAAAVPAKKDRAKPKAAKANAAAPIVEAVKTKKPRASARVTLSAGR